MTRKITQKGFTLIELLVVISIISILSSVVFSSLNTARSKARDAIRYSDARQIKNALEMYFSTYGYYPTCGGEDLCDSTGVLTPINTLEVVPTYISEIKGDPINENGYGYYYARGYKKIGTNTFIHTPGDNTNYIFGMRLENSSAPTYDEGWGNPNLNYLDGN